jgi:hypothetical protein
VGTEGPWARFGLESSYASAHFPSPNKPSSLLSSFTSRISFCLHLSSTFELDAFVGREMLIEGMCF